MRLSYFVTFNIIISHIFPKNFINPFQANVPILYPLNLWFSDVFRGYKKGTLAGLKWVKNPQLVQNI